MRRNRMIERACDVLRDHSPEMHKRLEIIADAFGWNKDCYCDGLHIKALIGEVKKVRHVVRQDAVCYVREPEEARER